MRSGTVAVIGRANAGKSTLINVMVGEKVAIVSPKPQTTRDRILGVLTRENYQIAFVDTPGIYKSRNVLTEDMMKTTETTSRDVDAILYVLDGHAGVREEDAELINKYAALGVPLIVAFTKIDIMPAGADAVAECEPIYEEFPGWKESTFGIQKWEDLPESARRYLTRLAEVAGAPIAVVSTGPDRVQTILRANPFTA